MNWEQTRYILDTIIFYLSPVAFILYLWNGVWETAIWILIAFGYQVELNILKRSTVIIEIREENEKT